ncbi:sensor histidine kinase [Halobacteriovorax vibrionivorans]|uniref:histidine kinase n=1 Tax=Halobacteriovorax vibrionivorans TaxID=2152716 RepID=A0ABY0IDS9_9BACT|nr:sensor histidine kinase [Halobacteriovorax vibrionivorans]
MDSMSSLYIVLLSFLLLCVVSAYVIASLDRETNYSQLKLALNINFFLYAIRFVFAESREMDIILFSLKVVPLYYLSNFFLDNRLKYYRKRISIFFVLGLVAGGILYLFNTKIMYYTLPIALGSFSPGIYALYFYGKRLTNLENIFYFGIFSVAAIVTLSFCLSYEVPGSAVWGWSAGVLTFISIMMGVLVKTLSKKVEGDHKLQEELKLINAIYKSVIHDTSNDLNFLSLSLARALRDESLSYVKRAYDRLRELIKFKEEMRKQFDGQDNYYELNPVDVFKCAISRYEEGFHEKNVQFITTAPIKKEEISLPISKESLVNSVLGNLLSNALKFTDSGLKVYFSMVIDHHFIYFSIIDSGQGIPEDIVKSVQSFSKVRSSAGTNKETGSGMGLSIICYIVNRIGGEVQFYRLERGTKVVVKIPYTKSLSNRPIDDLEQGDFISARY